MPTFGHSLLLDTSVVVKHFREPSTVLDKLTSAEGLCLPQPALGELYHGAYRSNRQETALARIERFHGRRDPVGPGQRDRPSYGQIAAELAQAGTPIPQNDVWIAALARQTGLTLATTDEHFDRVRNLAVVRW